MQMEAVQSSHPQISLARPSLPNWIGGVFPGRPETDAISLSLRTADQLAGPQRRAALPEGDPLRPSRDFFFGPSRRPPKRGLNRAYYNPVLPSEDLTATPPGHAQPPRSAPLERGNSLPSSIRRVESWSSCESTARSAPIYTEGHHEQYIESGGNFACNLFPPEPAASPLLAKWSPPSGVEPLSLGDSVHRASASSVGSSASVNSPELERVRLEKGVQVGLCTPEWSPSKTFLKGRAAGMYISSNVQDSGLLDREQVVSPPNAPRFDTARAAIPDGGPADQMVSSRSPLPQLELVTAEDYYDSHVELEANASDIEGGKETNGKLPWGALSPGENINNDFGVRILEIIERAEPSPRGSEIAGASDGREGFGVSEGDQETKGVDMPSLRAEHLRLAQMNHAVDLNGHSLIDVTPEASGHADPRETAASPLGEERSEEGGNAHHSREGDRPASANGHLDGAAIREGPGEGEAQSIASSESPGLEVRISPLLGLAGRSGENAMGGDLIPGPSNRMDEDSGNGSVGSESAHVFSGPQQTDSPMSRNGSRMALGGANERHLATLNSHQLYDFAYEARQRQMEAEISDLDQMKERFSKLLLGEDMSGGGKGVSTALAISNAITNLSAAVFGELHKLEPLGLERKRKWKRELEWLLCPADHIVEMVPAMNQSVNGSAHEVMMMQQRADLHASLPALRKLDTMLTECLDSFAEKGFWYVDPGHDSSGEFRGGTTPHQSGRWWLPEAMVSSKGLDERSARKLANQKGVATQILKAAMAINAQVLSEMAVPEAYWETLPKSSRSALGDQRYRILTGDTFSPDMILATVDLVDEHAALNCANDLEAAIHIWRRKTGKKAGDQDRDRFGNGYSPATDSSHRFKNAFSNVMGPMLEKREKHAGRAMDALWNLRLRCPGLAQTTLHVFKIQYNKDVGQAILESYSRVLESLASNILNRIEHVLAVDAATMEHLSFSRGVLSNSTPPTPSSQHSGPPSGSQTPTSPLREASVMYTGKTIPVLSASFTRRLASRPAAPATAM